ncbi:hypothetical protein [Pontibacter harenae]|uniref:hypothetical protein n=1 Tax=Pontibacter harenae TaxID=2894083 RepID=UPI001E606204|nr:hypothetical protein [Pontibacter harenae]MCC9165723.1 hypothetical protein [Pontibacter harenae]
MKKNIGFIFSGALLASCLMLSSCGDSTDAGEDREDTTTGGTDMQSTAGDTIGTTTGTINPGTTTGTTGVTTSSSGTTGISNPAPSRD